MKISELIKLAELPSHVPARYLVKDIYADQPLVIDKNEARKIAVKHAADILNSDPIKKLSMQSMAELCSGLRDLDVEMMRLVLRKGYDLGVA